jgi:Holliday junction resolvase
MARKPETVFRIRLRQRLNKIPNSWWESIQQSAISGTPDILGCVSGLFVAIEVKTDSGVTSRIQHYKIDQIKKAQGVALIITPSNLEESLIYLNQLQKSVDIF